MIVRAYSPADLQAVHVINAAGYPGVGAATPEQLAHIASESTIALVADVDDSVVGFCFVLAPGADYGSVNYQWFSERYDDFVYLDRVAISVTHQRRGIATAMYAEVERLASRRRPPASTFTLEVNLRPRNDDSLAFHARLGFVEVGQQETGYGTLVSLMSRPLGR